ncbi:MAG: insulinase family protein [Clostridium sp.]|nr:insulinase family protein [Clostridium sp.]
MKEYILDNGIRLIYIKGTSDLTSISIALNAGAAQDEKKLGIAHAVEHMIYKGTKTRSEDEINAELSRIFGFTNAMTNYPYVIFYGSLLREDFEKGLDLFSDILINPSFKEEGFKEEMDVIKQELKEWDEELEQYCEDKLLFNCCNNRLKYPIIGRQDTLNKITLNDIKKFYKDFYTPKNMVIAVVSKEDCEQVYKLVEKYFSEFKGQEAKIVKECYDALSFGEFRDTREGINNARVQINFPINELSCEELKAFRIFNEYFAEGVNSVLFDRLRTKTGLVYDVLSSIGYESYIKTYKVMFNTSKDMVEKTLKEVDTAIKDIRILEESKIKELVKSIKIKKLFKEEQSIRHTNLLAVYAVMFNDLRAYEKAYEDLDKIDGEFIFKTAKKVLKNSSIEIIS